MTFLRFLRLAWALARFPGYRAPVELDEIDGTALRVFLNSHSGKRIAAYLDNRIAEVSMSAVARSTPDALWHAGYAAGFRHIVTEFSLFPGAVPTHSKQTTPAGAQTGNPEDGAPHGSGDAYRNRFEP